MNSIAASAFGNMAQGLGGIGEEDRTAGGERAFGADSFYSGPGMKNLYFALFKQSIKDLVYTRKHDSAPKDVRMSAQWLRTDDGQNCVQFLMPSASPEIVIARIYAAPEAILDKLDQGEAVLSKSEASGDSSLALSSLSGEGDEFLNSRTEPVFDFDGSDDAAPLADVERTLG